MAAMPHAWRPSISFRYIPCFLAAIVSLPWAANSALAEEVGCSRERSLSQGRLRRMPWDARRGGTAAQDLRHLASARRPDGEVFAKQPANLSRESARHPAIGPHADSAERQGGGRGRQL